MSRTAKNDLEDASRKLAQLMNAARDVWLHTGLLLSNADALFGKRGWKRTSLNPHDSSWTNDSNFESWMPNLAYRHYANTERPNSVAFLSVIHGDRYEHTRYQASLVSAGVLWMRQPLAGLKQNIYFLNLPIVIAGFPTDGSVQHVNPSAADPDKVHGVVDAKVLARRLVEIQSKDDLETKVVSPVCSQVQDA